MVARGSVGVFVVDSRVAEVGLPVRNDHEAGFPVRAGDRLGDALDVEPTANRGAEGVGSRTVMHG